MKNTFFIFLNLLIIFFTAAAAAGADVTLAWDPNSEPNIGGYIIYWDVTAGPPFTNKLDVENVTQHTLIGLTEGQIYYFAVTAYTTDVPPLESDYSNTVEYLLETSVIIKVPTQPKEIRIIFD